MKNKMIMFSTPKEFLVLNSTDEPIEIGFDGEFATIPPYDEVVYAIEGIKDSPRSGKDSQGNYIPGSLIIADKLGERGICDGGRPPIWFAAEAIKHCLRIDPETGEASGDYAKRGLAVLPPAPDPEAVQAVKDEGRARYQAWQVDWAREFVNAYTERAGKHKAVALMPAPPPVEYDRAMAILQLADEERRASLKARLGSQEDEDAILQERAMAEVNKIAREAVEASGRAVDAAAVGERLLNDPDFMKVLKARIMMTGKGGKLRPSMKDIHKNSEGL